MFQLINKVFSVLDNHKSIDLTMSDDDEEESESYFKNQDDQFSSKSLKRRSDTSPMSSFGLSSDEDSFNLPGTYNLLYLLFLEFFLLDIIIV